MTTNEFDKMYDIGKTFLPLGDRVLIYMLDVKPKESKIQMIADPTNPNNNRMLFDEHPWQGLVLSVGPGFDTGNGIQKIEVKVGDRVALYNPPDPSRETILLEKRLFGIFRQANIMGVYVVEDAPVTKTINKSTKK